MAVHSNALMSDRETHRAVTEAIRLAEQHTDVEIVVAITPRSSDYPTQRSLLGLACGIAAVGVLAAFSEPPPVTGGWGNPFVMHVNSLLALICVLAGYLLSSAAARRLPWLLRLITTHKTMDSAVRRKGLEAFYRLRVHTTAKRHGMLIFVSLDEHIVWVAGDDQVTRRLPDDTWQQMREAVLAGLRRNDPGGGLTEGVRLAGELAGAAFPKSVSDSDELLNELHVIP